MDDGSAACDEHVSEALRRAKSRFAHDTALRPALFLMLSPHGGGGPAGAEVLRYVSQRADKAYLREGPTYAHKVLWVYRHRGYPFAVIAQFDVWRRVRAADGTVGWMSASMLTDQRTVSGDRQGAGADLAPAPGGGKVVALADPGAIASLKACARDACRDRGDGHGWLDRQGAHLGRRRGRSVRKCADGAVPEVAMQVFSTSGLRASPDAGQLSGAPRVGRHSPQAS